LLAQALFPPSHRAIVGFMIVSRQMQHSVQRQNLDFFRRRVAEAACILGRDIGGNRHISSESFRGEVRRRKR
jgi:hypothetical protein